MGEVTKDKKIEREKSKFIYIYIYLLINHVFDMKNNLDRLKYSMMYLYNDDD
jgi:hypothetical protein